MSNMWTEGSKEWIYSIKNGEHKQHYKCTRCKISISIEHLIPTYRRDVVDKDIIVLIIELTMMVGITVQGTAQGTAQERLNAS